MKKRYDYDIIAIGGGIAGITAVTLARKLGKKAALIDKKEFGGEFMWSGLPSKRLLHIAGNFRTSKIIYPELSEKSRISGMRAAHIRQKNKVMPEIRAMIKKAYADTRQNFDKLGISVFENTRAVFVDPHTVEMNNKPVTSSVFIIATGSRPVIPHVEGLDKIKYYTSSNIFSLPKLPVSMSVLGGSPVGIELASAFNRLGVKVSVIEMSASILPEEDNECSTILTDILRSEGIKIITEARIVGVENNLESGNAVIYENKDGRKERIKSEIVLVTADKRPNVEGLGLEPIGVRYTYSCINVDKTMRTTVKNIFAAGDVTGLFQYSHVANYQSSIAVYNAFTGLWKRAGYSNIPWCTFTDPELARSGMTENEARKKYKDRIKIYRIRFSDIDRAKTDKKEAGLAKFVCAQNGRMLGVHILGSRAGEIIHEVQAAKSMSIPLHRLNSVVHIYPTYSEAVSIAAKEAYSNKIRNSLLVKFIERFRSLK